MFQTGTVLFILFHSEMFADRHPVERLVFTEQ